MSQFKIHSGIDYIEQNKPLSEWAKEFIASHNLSLSNISRDQNVKLLSRSQKDALRYQLKKSSRKPGQIAQTLSQRSARERNRNLVHLPFWKLIISFWISAFLINDIVKIYTDKGLGLFSAWQAAILVELCIFIGSASTGKMRKAAYLLLIYNFLLFLNYELNQLDTTNKSNSFLQLRISEKENDISELRTRRSKILEERNKNYTRLDKALSNGFVSAGTSALEKLNRSADSTIANYSEDISSRETEVSNLKTSQKNITQEISLAALVIFMRGCLQLFSIWLLRREC